MTSAPTLAPAAVFVNGQGPTCKQPTRAASAASVMVDAGYVWLGSSNCSMQVDHDVVRYWCWQ